MKKRRFLRCLTAAAVALMLSLPAAVYADEVQFVPKAEDINKDEDLSLTVWFLEGDDVPVCGAEINICMAASVESENYRVTYTALYGDYTYEGISVSESNEIASELAEAAQSGELDQSSAVTDDAGCALFTDLSAGIYLVYTNTEDETEDGGYTFEPFLVCVPLAQEENGIYVWIYDVEAYPKSVIFTEKETETSEEAGETPSTADETNLILWACTAAAALCGAGLLGITLKRRKVKD